MGKNQHTPGPWYGILFDCPAVYGEDRVPLPPGYWICRPADRPLAESKKITLMIGNDNEAEANARLIAAAPDLLEACKAMLAEMVVWEDEHGTHPAAGLARTAIAKAVGREPQCPA